MTNQDKHRANGGLYLEDLYVGQRFTNGAHAVDEAQIKVAMNVSRAKLPYEPTGP